MLTTTLFLLKFRRKLTFDCRYFFNLTLGTVTFLGKKKVSFIYKTPSAVKTASAAKLWKLAT